MSEIILISSNENFKFDLLIDDIRWNEIGNLSALTLKIIEEVFEYLYLYKSINNCYFCIKLTDDKELQSLNKNFRNKNKPTNVLSFPNYEFKNGDLKSLEFEVYEIYLGDIAISYDCVFNEHLAQNKPFKNHYTHIIVHGILHLLGYDHEDDQEAQVMEDIEINILKLLGIPNPYEKI